MPNMCFTLRKFDDLLVLRPLTEDEARVLYLRLQAYLLWPYVEPIPLTSKD
jgi:hypothetical protein